MAKEAEVNAFGGDVHRGHGELSWGGMSIDADRIRGSQNRTSNVPLVEEDGIFILLVMARSEFAF